MLSHMTKEWSDAANSLAIYILSLRKRDRLSGSLDPLDAYNDWLHQSGRVISDSHLACWAMEHTNFLLNIVPLPVLEEAVKQDNLPIGVRYNEVPQTKEATR